MERKKVLRSCSLISLVAIVFVLGMMTSVCMAGSKYVFKAGHSQRETHPWHVGMTYFAEKVFEKTNGQVKIEVYPNGVLGREDEMAEAVQMGTLHISGAAVPQLASIVPRAEVLEMPYVYRSYTHMQNVCKGPVGDYFKKEFEEKGLKLLTFYTNAKRCLYNRKRPVYSPDDLEGIKIRVMPGQVQVDTWRALGAMPTPIPFGEIYTSLQTGVIDAAEPDPNTEWEQKHYEVAPYLSLTEHTIPVRNVIMNLKLFNSLPPEIQKSIVEAAEESEPYEWKYDADLHEKAILRLLSKGVKINLVDKAPFIERTESVRQNIVKKYGLEKIYKMMIETKD